MMMRLLLAAALATGLAFAPAVFAEDAMKPAVSKSKKMKTAKAHKRIEGMSRSPAATKKPDSMMGEPYRRQKDEMTR
jgi:pentapeptide MXKDX repeat protein